MTIVFDANDFDPQQVQLEYSKNGYFVLKGVFSKDEIHSLHAETIALCSSERGDLIGASVITNGAASPEEAMQRVLAIHFPHKVSELMKETLTQPSIVRALKAVIGPDIKCMQSMLFVKNAGKPGQAWHQDEFYIPTRDKSLAGVWIALDDARIDNGGLWMHPGSHKDGVLWPTHAHKDQRFDSADEAYGFPYEREGGVPVEADAGDVVIFHGYTLHLSLNNTRAKGYRRALVNHVMSARSLLPWGIGMPPAPRNDFRDFEMVCGKDPYEWKGKEDILMPFLRADDPEQSAQIFGELFKKVQQ